MSSQTVLLGESEGVLERVSKRSINLDLMLSRRLNTILVSLTIRTPSPTRTTRVDKTRCPA
jgi:hypothetical protein